MKRLAWVVIGVFLLTTIVVFVPQPSYAHTGSGTVGDPYLIYDDNDLQDMKNHLTSYWELANDIDATNTSTWNGGLGFEPVGTSAAPFQGFLDGNGYTITGLTINRTATSYVGLFGAIKNTYAGTTRYVRNVNFDDSYISGASYVGTLCGYVYSESDTKLVNISYINVSNGTMLASGTELGGLLGAVRPWTTVEYCSVSLGTTILTAHSGVFVGDVEGASGAAVGVHIYRCSSSGSISYTQPYGAHTGEVGGFVGDATLTFGYGTAEIRECYATGSVYNAASAPYNAYYVGGFAGYTVYISFYDCYSTVDVTTVNGYGVGGFIGSGGGAYNCYSTGAVSTTGSSYVGGLVGRLEGSCGTNSFWDKETSGQTTSACGTGKLTSEMKLETTFTNVGWDFDDVWGIFPIVNEGYPFLLYNTGYYQAVWFQPNTIIQGTVLPNRASNATYPDGEIHWGSNPTGIEIEIGIWEPESEYDFEPVIPTGWDIINPEPESMIGDVDTERLHNNPLYPLVQVLSIGGFLNERLVWLGLAWFILIAAMFGVHLGFDTKKDTEKPQHFVLTTIVGLGFSILFYTMGIFPWWVILLMAFGLIGAIIWERQPVL